MTGNSLQSLLDWMKDTSRMHEWDVLMALSGSRINQGLQHEYAERVSRGADWQVPGMQVPIPTTSATHYFEGLILGPPIFTLEQPTLDSPATQLRFPLLGGSDMLVDSEAGIKSIERLASWGPLNSPALLLELRLEGAQGLLQVDPSEAEEVLLDFAGTDTQQREAGKLFLEWFKGLAPERRTWPVASLAGPDNPMLHASVIKVRTQANPASPAPAAQGGEREGALLLFASMEHGVPGGIPGNNSGFKYLLPDDSDQEYSATVLFSSHLLHRAALAAGVQGLVQQGQFDYLPATGLATQMVAKAGTLQVAASALWSESFEFQSGEFTISAASTQPLSVAFQYTGARQTWQATCAVPVRYRLRSGGDWQTHSASFQVKIDFEFHLAAEASARLGMEGHLFVPYGLNEEARHVSGLPSLPAGQREQLEGLVALTVKRALLEKYTQSLRIDASQAFLAGNAVATGMGVEPAVQALPHDLAVFGRLTDHRLAWRIAQRQPQLVADQTLQLTIEPAREGLNWSVQNPPGSGGDPGSIDDQGLYRAPPAHALGGPARRILVIASDPLSGEWSFTLVTVVARAISVDPLIEVCNYSERVPLSARHASDATLRWAIADPVSGESGMLEPAGDDGRTCTYIAHPQVAGKTYVLDKVVVSEPGSGQQQSAWLLVQQIRPDLTVRLHPGSTPGEGQIQLQARFGSTVVTPEWVPAPGSPGRITAQGLYQADPGASAAFALLFARLEDEGDLFEGHIILPLPLEQFPIALQALAQP